MSIARELYVSRQDLELRAGARWLGCMVSSLSVPVGLLLVSQMFTRSCLEAVVSRGTSGRVTVTASVAAPLTEAPGSGLRIQLQT